MLGRTRQDIKGENAKILQVETWDALAELLKEVKDHFKSLDILTEKITEDMSFLIHVSRKCNSTKNN